MQKKKILFLVWGYSIHAFRRMSIFTENPLYEVLIVSTYSYQLENATTIRLSKAIIKDSLKKIKNKQPEINIGDSKSQTYKNFSIKSRIKKYLIKIVKSKLFIFLIFPIDIIVGLFDYAILRNAVKSFNPSLIFLQTLMYPNYLSYLLPKRFKLMVTFWNGDVIWWKKKNSFDLIFKNQIVKYGGKRLAAVTVNSELARQDCLKLGYPIEKINLIRYPGVDMKLFHPIEKESARKYLQIKANKVVLWPRGIGGYLNDPTLMAAIGKVIEKHKDIVFLMLGPNSEKGEEIYNDFLNKHKYNSYFRWVGLVDWKQMLFYYSAADIMVSISSNDSLPNCMLESMGMKIPVIMGDIPQIQEWVTNSVNGYLVDVEDSDDLANRIIHLFDNKELVNQFVEKSYNLVERNASQEKNTRLVKELVNNLLSN
jgi:glycosyltransferase involved in cell wall biosynthesis